MRKKYISGSIMWYFTKQTLFLFVYLLFMSFVSFAVSAIQIFALKIVLLVLSLALYTFIVCASSFKEGQEAVKLLNSNDMQRRRIVETGEYIKLKTAGEYKAWKGFIFGLIVVAPLIICMIVHVILSSATGANGAGAVAGLVYSLFYAPYSIFLSETALVSNWQYYILLYAIPYMMGACGVPYLLGARKMQLQYDKIQEKHKELYGENS